MSVFTLLIGIGSRSASAAEPYLDIEALADDIHEGASPADDLQGSPQALGQKGPHPIYINYDGVTLSVADPSNSAANTSSVNGCSGTFPAYGDGPNKDMVTELIRADWAPFNVTIVTSRPAASPYTMLVMTPRTCGQGGTGEAPLHCGLSNPNAVGFAYYGATTDAHPIIQANVASQEIAHTFGMVHVNNIADIVSGVGYNSDASAVDQCNPVVGPFRCPEVHGQHCPANQQNTYKSLLSVLGPAVADKQPPTVRIVTPVTGTTYPAGANVEIVAEAADESGVRDVKLWMGTMPLTAVATPPYRWPGGNIQPGMYTFSAVATDLAGNETRSAEVMITVAQPGQAVPPVPGMPGSASAGSASAGSVTVGGATAGTGGASGVTIGPPVDEPGGCAVVGVPLAGMGSWSFLGLALAGVSGARRRRRTAASVAGRS